MWTELSDPAILQKMGRRIRDYRMRMEMTQSELAEKSGVSMGTIVRVEQGNPISTLLLISILRTMGLLENLEVLLSGDDCGLLLTLRGCYTAVKSKGAFSYEFFLRPWGSLWPEQEDALPGHYRDWYLPLVEAGEDMPPELWNANGKDANS